jgi:hypothetical protein
MKLPFGGIIRNALNMSTGFRYVSDKASHNYNRGLLATHAHPGDCMGLV